MTTLYLIRHGETEWNKQQRIQGKQNIDLSEIGLEQAKLLAKRLSHEHIDYIYTSSLNRAKVTAQTIADYCKLDLIESDDYHEIGLGPWEGLTITEIMEKYADQHAVYRKDPGSFYLEGAETFDDLIKRTHNSILDVVKKHTGKKIVIVSHGVTLKAAIMKILDLDIKYYTKFRIDNASISIINYNSDSNEPIVIQSLNDTSHLNINRQLKN